MRGATLPSAGALAPARHVVANGLGIIRTNPRFGATVASSPTIREPGLEGFQRIAETDENARVAELTAALEVQTLLLAEVDHRVKNSLAMIGALLRIQARTTGDPAIAATLGTMLERVDAVTAVHRRFHESTDVRRLDASALAEDLASDVIGASGRTDIAMAVRIEPLLVAGSSASSLGLILNELMTNAVKHAFSDGRPGTLAITARSEGDQGIIEVRDDGLGMKTANHAKPVGLGRMLIERLARQAQAHVTWSDAEPGTSVRLSFPIEP